MVGNAKVSYINDTLGNLKNLQIFILHQNYEPIGLPFESLSKLTKLKAVSLTEIPNALSTIIPESFCNLKEIIYFELQFITFISDIPFDCIASEWKSLEYFKMEVIPFVHDIPTHFWLLPNLQTVLIDFSKKNTSYFTFDSFTSYSTSLKNVSLTDAGVLCNGSIRIDNIEYAGFGYLGAGRAAGVNFTAQDVENHALLQFIQQYHPCFFPCSHYGAQCVPSYYQNGVCEDQCNREECNFDGGDCNQLCQCDSNLWFNDICDVSCNTTLCSYDFEQCVNDETNPNDTCSDVNNTTISWDTDGNYTHNSSAMDDTSTYTNEDIWSSVPCYTSWIGDGWCDKSCNVDECDNDGGRCDTCSLDAGDDCGTAYALLMGLISTKSDPFELIAWEDVCGVDYIGAISDVVAIVMEGYNNCTEAFYGRDMNGNGYIGFYEAIIATASVWVATEETNFHYQDKLLQIDCSHCMVNSSLYYW